MSKIVVKPKDEITAVVEQVIGAGDEDITLVVPASSIFGRTILNFQLLARESKSAGKRVTVESESEEILKMASGAGCAVIRREARGGAKQLGTKTPRVRSKSVSDVISSSAHTLNLAQKADALNFQEDGQEPASITDTKNVLYRIGIRKVRKPASASQPPPLVEKKAPIVSDFQVFDKEGSFRKAEEGVPQIFAPREEYTAAPPPRSAFQKIGHTVKKGFFVALVAVVGSGVLYAGLLWLPKAEVDVVMKKHAWEFKDAILVRKDIADIVLDPPAVPGEIAVLTKSVDVDVPVTGRKDISQKARGMIDIYNAYSSESQRLVATTRFVSPDGKIFRLDGAVVVPGAKIVDGEIIPSSVRARVTADTPGEAYNISPVAKFTIPGFQGSAKFNGFYGASDAPMTGGFVGEANVVAQIDMDTAREKARALLEESLRQELALKMPEGFRSVEGFEDVSFDEITFSHAVGEATEVVKAHADLRLRSAFFKEEHIQRLFKTLAENALGFETAVREEMLQYGVGRVDFSQGKGSFPVQYQSQLVRRVDMGTLRQSLIGKNKTETKSLIFSLPGLESATVSFWPFWVRKVPQNVDRVIIKVE